MNVLGVVVLIVGFLSKIVIVRTPGITALVFGAALAIPGGGRAVEGRRPCW